jgi:hypothetical protein
MTGLIPSERPVRAESENLNRLESVKRIALLFVLLSAIWVFLSVFWPATFGSLTSEYELVAFLLLVAIALSLACASDAFQTKRVSGTVPTPAARETLISVSLPEMPVHRADPAVSAGQRPAPHTTAPVSEPVLTLPE